MNLFFRSNKKQPVFHTKNGVFFPAKQQKNMIQPTKNEKIFQSCLIFVKALKFASAPP